VAGGWRRLHNEELQNLYGSPNIVSVDKIKENVMEGACSTDGRNEKCMKNFWRKILREETTRKI
jgi:hypothetical protein